MTDEQLRSYEDQLARLNVTVNEAKKNVVIAETNLENYEKNRAEVIKEAEGFIGKDISNIDQILEQKTQELQEIMDRLSQVDINNIADPANAEMIQKIVEDYNVPEPV